VNFPFFNWNADIIRPEIAPMFRRQAVDFDAKIVTFEMFCDIFEKLIIEINREKQTK
jgi:hypothetical protein